jgi:hypothetical protein
MISIQIFKQASLPKIPVTSFIKDNLKEWIRKEIVNNDPTSKKCSFLKTKESNHFSSLTGGD